MRLPVFFSIATSWRTIVSGDDMTPAGTFHPDSRASRITTVAGLYVAARKSASTPAAFALAMSSLASPESGFVVLAIESSATTARPLASQARFAEPAALLPKPSSWKTMPIFLKPAPANAFATSVAAASSEPRRFQASLAYSPLRSTSAPLVEPHKKSPFASCFFRLFTMPVLGSVPVADTNPNGSSSAMSRSVADSPPSAVYLSSAGTSSMVRPWTPPLAFTSRKYAIEPR